MTIWAEASDCPIHDTRLQLTSQLLILQVEKAGSLNSPALCKNGDHSLITIVLNNQSLITIVLKKQSLITIVLNNQILITNVLNKQSLISIVLNN